MGKAKGESLKVGFDGSIMIEFHGTKVTSHIVTMNIKKKLFAEILFRIKRLRCYSV